MNTTESGNKTGATIAGGGRTSMNSTKPANNVRTMATSVGGATVNTTESGNKTGATIAGGDRTSVNSTNPGNATKTTAATGGGATVNTTASVHNTGPLNVGLDTTPTMVTRESTRNDTVEIGSTGNKGERGTVGISGTKGRDGERGTSGLDGRDSIKNMNHSAPDLTRNRASSIAAGSKVNRSAQMKDNLKARINERKNNE